MMTDENDIVIEPVEDADDAPTPSKATPSVVDTTPILEEPIMTNETAVSPPPPAPVSQRRGCVLLFFGAILGAVLGTVLTLSILLGLNGSLSFTSTDAQLQRAINDTRIQQENMEAILATRSTYLDAMATQVSGVALEQAEASASVDTVEAEMSEILGVVTAVSTQVSGLDERIDTTEGQIESVATTAAEFDTFLTGLKTLLLDGEATATATRQPTSVPTADSGTVQPTATGNATIEPTTTVRATRTPRPTSTPLPLPTSTTEP